MIEVDTDTYIRNVIKMHGKKPRKKLAKKNKTNKPDWDKEVYPYLLIQIEFYLAKAKHFPEEQREEMGQEAQIRVYNAWKDKMNDRQGWKSFVQKHVWGSTLDYQKTGKGFQSDNWTIKNPKEAALKKNPDMLRQQLIPVLEEDDSIEDFWGRSGILSRDSLPDVKFDWGLIARMARLDISLHIVAKMALGFKATELAVIFGIKRESIAQKYQNLLKRLDKAIMIGDAWTEQVIYAFGLQEQFGMRAIRPDFMYDTKPVDLYSNKIWKYNPRDQQLSMDFGPMGDIDE